MVRVAFGRIPLVNRISYLIIGEKWNTGTEECGWVDGEKRFCLRRAIFERWVYRLDFSS
jgi:hypothetical protein